VYFVFSPASLTRCAGFVVSGTAPVSATVSWIRRCCPVASRTAARASSVPSTSIHSREKSFVP